MPFKSKAQQRYLFATNPTVAREFVAGTDFSKLPEKKKKDAVKKAVDTALGVVPGSEKAGNVKTKQAAVNRLARLLA